MKKTCAACDYPLDPQNTVKVKIGFDVEADLRTLAAMQ